MLKKMTAFLFAGLFSLTISSQVPKHEVRAVWLTTIKSLDWPQVKATSAESIERQKQQLCDILDRLHRANVNTILLQTRIRATTIYPSQYEPFDDCLTGKAGRHPGYDPLKFAIDECHRRGMELHAWIVTIPVGKNNSPGTKQLRNRYPSMLVKIGDESYMDPGSSQTGPYLSKICKEIVDNYDVDGIHLDYIRYPENWKFKYSRQIGRNNITSIVRQIHQTVKGVKPWVKISCSPIGKFSDLSFYSSYGWNAYEKVCQDAQGWLREGLMDQLYPMMYFRGDNFYPFAVDWKANTYGRMVAPGLAIWLLSRREGNDWPLIDITRELNVLRNMGLGHTYFRSRFFTDNVKGIYDYMVRDLDSYPALIPPMTWVSSTKPTQPQGMNVNQMSDAVRLEWWGARDRSNGPQLLYNVYSSTQSPVDVNDARNLIAHHLTSPHLTIRGDAGNHYFAITAIDRYGNESDALQSTQKHKPQIEWISNDGRKLKIPTIDPSISCDYISIVSMAGNVMTIRPNNHTDINIRTIPEGVYELHAVDRHKHSRRIGQFMIKR